MIPKLYETEGVPCKDKLIHEVWVHGPSQFYWLIAEMGDDGLAFGYANLNDDQNAEWGYIDTNELKSVRATKIDCPMPRKASSYMALFDKLKEENKPLN
jgi:hypothetical protein